MEKFTEFSVALHHLFVDFETAFDKVFRRKLWNALAELGYPTKLIDLARMAHVKVKRRVREGDARERRGNQRYNVQKFESVVMLTTQT